MHCCKLYSLAPGGPQIRVLLNYFLGGTTLTTPYIISMMWGEFSWNFFPGKWYLRTLHLITFSQPLTTRCTMLEANVVWWISIISLVHRLFWSRVDLLNWGTSLGYSKERWTVSEAQSLKNQFAMKINKSRMRDAIISQPICPQFLPHLWVDWGGSQVIRSHDLPLTHLSSYFLSLT